MYNALPPRVAKIPIGLQTTKSAIMLMAFSPDPAGLASKRDGAKEIKPMMTAKIKTILFISR